MECVSVSLAADCSKLESLPLETPAWLTLQLFDSVHIHSYSSALPKSCPNNFDEAGSKCFCQVPRLFLGLHIAVKRTKVIGTCMASPKLKNPINVHYELIQTFPAAKF